MKLKFPTSGRARDTVFSGIFVLLAAAVLALSLLLPNAALLSGFFLDNTPEGLYSLSDEMVKQCAFLDELEDGQKIEIIFCTDPDILMSSTVTRAPYVTALRLANEFDSVTVKTVNAAQNPTAVAKYRSGSLAAVGSSNVIISSGDRYRVTTFATFWTMDSDNSTYWGYNGEYRYATLLLSVTAVNRPAAYFITGHGETVFDTDPASEGSLATATLREICTDLNMRCELLDLSTVDAVPDDCVLLILNNPTSDFVDNGVHTSLDIASDLEKIDRYLVSKQGALAVAKSPEVSLPELEQLLKEWGFDFGDTTVKDTSHTISADGTRFTAVYNTEDGSYGNDIYGEFASAATAPKAVMENTGIITCSFSDGEAIHENGIQNVTRTFSPFFYAPDEARAYAYDSVSGDYTALAGEAAGAAVAAITARVALDGYTSEYSHSYVFAAASGDFFSEACLASSSYSNFDVVSVMFASISRVDEYASITLGGPSGNSPSYGGKQLIPTDLSEEETEIYKPDATELIRVVSGISTGNKVFICIMISLLPIAVAAVGIAVRIRRKYR